MDDHTSREELAMIRRLMEESQRTVRENGIHYLAWGVLTAAALVATYLLAAMGTASAIGWVWVVAIALGWIFSISVGRRQQGAAPVRTLAGRLLGAIWVGCGIALTLLGFVGSTTGAIPAGSLQGILASVIGIGYFASSFIYGSATWRYFAAAWWVGAAVMLVWPGAYTLLLLAALVVALEIVPGTLLYVRSRREPSLAAG